MSEPTLSVVTANYNYAHYIGEALEAILSQSFRPLEVIVIDDVSTDDSIPVIEEFVRRDPIVRLLRNERNMGIVFNMNRGLRDAQGDFVCFSSSDDRVLPGLFEKSMKLLARYPEAGVCGSLTRIMDEEGKDLGLVSPAPPWISKVECYLPPAKARDAFLRYGVIWHAANTAFYRRKAFLEAGGFDPELRSYSDAFMFQVLAVKHGACFIPEPLGVWRKATSSTSSQEQSTEVYLDLKRHAIHLMRSRYSNLFSEEYIRKFWNDSRYTAHSIAYGKLHLRQGKCLADFERILEQPNLVDRMFLTGLRFGIVLQYLYIRLYFLSRLRRFTWPRVASKVKSILKRMMRPGQTRS